MATAPAELEQYWAMLDGLQKHKSFAASYIQRLANHKPNPPMNPEQQKVADDATNCMKL